MLKVCGENYYYFAFKYSPWSALRDHFELNAAENNVQLLQFVAELISQSVFLLKVISL